MLVQVYRGVASSPFASIDAPRSHIKNAVVRPTSRLQKYGLQEEGRSSG